MKDIDFDELDKAVNSLMATTPGLSGTEASTPVPAPAEASPAPAPSSTPAAPVPPVSAPAPSASPSPVASDAAPTPVVVRSVPPAARRSGRFMDMVHTSSDMKPRAEASAPALATSSREGLSVTPRTEAEAPSTPAPEPVEVPQASYNVASQSMPDPIDIASASAPESVEAEQPANTVAEQTDQPDVMTLGSLESPFLSDAKVEKRPLNAGTDTTPELVADAGIAEDVTHVASDELDDKNGSDEPPAIPAVPELSSDLVAIESKENVVDMTQAVETSEAISQVDTPAVPLGPASIAQQYVQQPSTGDQSHAAIYDASQYPEPLAHPAKNKSGWLWIVWVILLLGVGAGGALVLYNLGIIP